MTPVSLILRFNQLMDIFGSNSLCDAWEIILQHFWKYLISFLTSLAFFSRCIEGGGVRFGQIDKLLEIISHLIQFNIYCLGLVKNQAKITRKLIAKNSNLFWLSTTACRPIRRIYIIHSRGVGGHEGYETPWSQSVQVSKMVHNFGHVL